MKVMKKSISLILVLVILLNVICINSFATEVTEIPVQIPCQYIVEFEIKDGYFDGYYIDGNIYVEPSIIGMLTGFNVNEDAAEIIYAKDKPTSSFFYRLEMDERKIIRHAIGSETEWDVDVRKLSNGNNVINLEETLLAMNVQMAVSDEENFLLCTYLPYTVYDAWREFVNHYPALFSWSEVEADRNNSDPKLEGVLSAVSQLYFEYNDHFVSDAVISWWSQDVLNATEEQFMDTMSEILLCMTKDHNKYVADESLYNFYEQTAEEMDLATDFIDLLEPDGDLLHVAEGLEKSASFISAGYDIVDTVNIIEQYKSIQETQRDVLKELFVNYPMYAQAKDSSSKHLYNAAKHLSQRIDDSALGNVTTICDAIIDFAVEQLGDVVSSVSPILVVLNASTTIVKNTPGLSNQIDSLAHINIGCNAWALLMLSINNYNTWVENFYNYMFPTENEMNQLRLTMLFRIMASLTARQHFILSNELSPATVAAMEQKNKELTGLYFLIEKSKTITASRDNSPQIRWDGYLETIRSDAQMPNHQKEDEASASGTISTPERLLVSAEWYIDGALCQMDQFSYNSQNKLIRHINNGYNDGEFSYSDTTEYGYDNDGNLLFAKETDSPYAITEYHYDNGILTGYTFNEIRQGVIIISTTYLYERDTAGNIVKMTSSGTDADVWTNGDYVYENGKLISARERERYGDHNFERNMAYDYSYNGAVIVTEDETMANFYEHIRKMVRFGSLETGTVFDYELPEDYSIITDEEGYIAYIQDGSGQTNYIFTYEEASPPEHSSELSTGKVLSFNDIPSNYVFTSGVGAWMTGLTISPDGSFIGEYHDSDMGATGEGYPNGTFYYCSFHGKFSKPVKVNEYTYKMSLESLQTEVPEGLQNIEDGVLKIATKAYGFDDSSEYYLYLPGIPSFMMPQTCFDRINQLYMGDLPSYRLYTICGETGEYPFVAESK